FAVVADEVRSLASRTQSSTEQIQQIITSLRDGAARAVQTANKGEQISQESVASVEAVQKALDGISQSVTRITGMSQQMASASEEQSHVAENISQQITRIAQLCDESASQAQQGSQISGELEEMAQYLHSLAERFSR
ncbi:methyl-accepting chemotaxis protein, partial [Pseudomonas amygdali]